MIVKNILPRALERLAVIEAEAPVREAAALMSKPHTDLIVVCDHGDMVGVLTKTDIVGQIGRCVGAGCMARVDSIMTRDVTYCRTHEVLLDVWSVMRERGLQRVPILDEGTQAARHHLCAGSLAGSAVRIGERGRAASRLHIRGRVSIN